MITILLEDRKKHALVNNALDVWFSKCSTGAGEFKLGDDTVLESLESMSVKSFMVGCFE